MGTDPTQEKTCTLDGAFCYVSHLLLSLIVTVALPGLPRVTPSGNEDGLIVRVKSLSCSNISSVYIGTSNGTLVPPAGNVTVYGPES